MEGEPRYALEQFDAVLQELGCVAETSAIDHLTRAWLNPASVTAGVPAIAAFRTDAGELAIGLSSVESISRLLGLDPHEVLRRLANRGGELLDP